MSLETGSPFRTIAESGLRAFEHNQAATGRKIGGRAWIASVIRHGCDNVQGDLQDGLAALGTVGMVALAVGVLGALCGIYVALNTAETSGHAALAQLAVPVGSALLCAIFGLAIAIRSISARDRLDRRNALCMEQVRSFCLDLRTILCAVSAMRTPLPIAAGAN